MSVTLRAVQRQSEPRRAHCRDPILHGLDPVFLGVAAALVIDLRIAVEAGGDLLLQRRLWQQVSSELLNCKLIERLVAVEGVDHPLAVRPDGAREIHLITIGVGIARQIQPATRHVFAVVGRREQAIDQLLVCLRRCILHECLHLVPRWWKPGEIQAESPGEGVTVGFSLRRQPFLFQTGPHEEIDLIPRPTRVGVGGQGGTHRFHERPMLAGIDLGPRRSLLNPLAHCRHFAFRQSRALRWHDVVRVGSGDPLEQFAGVRLPRDQRSLARFARQDRRRA